MPAFSVNDRYVPIKVIGDLVFVNMDSISDRDYSLRGKDELIHLAHKLGTNKKFLFVFEDGTNTNLTGATEVIQYIINTLGLTRDTCGIFCREKLNIENAQIVVEESVWYWVRTLQSTTKISNIPLPLGPFAKKFAVWFNRGALNRLEITKHLKTNYNNESFISYQERGLLCDPKYREYFADAILWAEQNTPIIHDIEFPNRVYTHEMIAGSRKPYNEYFIEVVVETDVNSNSWLTEKTVRNLYVGKAFLLMSGPGSLKKLQSLGFKTFSPWINESYDAIDNNYCRLNAIKDEIDRIARCSMDEINLMHKEMIPVLNHNRDLCRNITNSICQTY